MVVYPEEMIEVWLEIQRGVVTTLLVFLATLAIAAPLAIFWWMLA